mmetsp:Transcript_82991/g.189565  ORF Transcript_82991/g.189565 Transcript_82991/m.189565 type:complete len:270 (+) Transcript_82991:96-905(+)
MSSESASEASRLEAAERVRSALESRNASLMQENADLKSRLVDLKAEGEALREVLGSQGESYLSKVSDLQAAVAALTEDRTRFTQDQLSLQEEVKRMKGELGERKNDQGRCLRLEAERQALTKEVERLRASNSALAQQLMGDDVGLDHSGGDPEAAQLLQGYPLMGGEDSDTTDSERNLPQELAIIARLQKRCIEFGEEKEELAERMEALERRLAAQSAAGLSSLGSAPSPAPPKPAEEVAPAAEKDANVFGSFTSLGKSVLSRVKKGST